MKSNFYLLVSTLLVLGSVPALAQIGIGTKTPAASAALEVTSIGNNKGILIPRISATQKDAIVSPAEGLLIYQTTAPTGFYYYTGSAWKLMVNATDLLLGNTATADNVTGIVAIANGGTNSTAVATAGGIGYGTGTAHAYTGAGTTGQLLSSNGAGVPTWLTPAAGGIPYTGATAAVDLGAYDLKVNGLTVGKGGGSVGSNTANGLNALYANTTGVNNIAAGYEALKSNTIGYSNAAFGGSALTSNTIGFYNTALGKDALRTNLTGLENTGVGLSSLYSNNGGSYNTAIGSSSLDENTSGEYNTAMGRQALSSTTTGSNNAAVGAAALNTNTTGANNIAIGYAADVASGALNNATAIGASAIVSASNTIQLGNTDVTNVKTSGTITAGAVTYPNTHNTIAGQILNTDASGLASWATPTKAMVGLSSVNNTSDFEKPISTLTQLALNTKFTFEVSNEFSASAGQTSFTLTNTPGTNSKVKMYINGIRISNTSYSIVTNNDITTLTYNPVNNGVYALIIGDRIQFDFSY